MLAVSNLSLNFGGRVMFDGISFLLNRSDKIGLVGRNGAGKSTLLKAIKGVQRIDGGDVMYPRDTVIGYLPQDIPVTSQLKVIDETKKAFEHLLDLQREQDELQHQLETRTDYESDEYMELINRVQDVAHQIELHGAGNMDEECELVLKGLGFEQADFEKPVSSLSGGWQMRIELAKILLQKPDVVLLDEPTNHLDIESVLWLEEFLKKYDGGIIMVSHDKTFLDNITNRTIEIVNGRIEDYKANYSKYVELRKERREQQINAAKNQQRDIAQIERNIERFRAKASKATFAQSLIKKLDKMEIIQVDEEDVAAMNLRFPQPSPSGKVVVRAENLSKSYGTKNVFSNQSFEIERGDRIAFVGKNGMGKSTLSKILVGELKDYEGNLQLGHNVSIGFYAQHAADSLNPSDTALDVVDHVATGEIRTKLRDLLGCFLFSGDDVYKKVKVLSGGEKSRLALCKMILEPRNFLVLDEPTNHLDMTSKRLLRDALNKFEGTIVVVSHDRDFLHGLVNKVFEFTPRGIKVHLCGIEEFIENKQLENIRALEQADPAGVESKPKETVSKDKGAEREQDKELKKLKREVEKLENEITAIEGEIKAAENTMNNPDAFKTLNSDFFNQYEALKQRLKQRTAAWEELLLQLEK